MSSSSISCFDNFIFLENFFCINRSYLIESARKRIFGNVIFVATSILIISVGINNALTSNIDLGTRMFQSFLVVEFVFLVITARLRKYSFDALKKLDEKCGIEDDYVSKLVTISTKYAVFTFASAAIDVIGLKLLSFNFDEAFIYSVLFSAQDAELIFFGMIVETINSRLSELKHASPVFGSKVYRHVLVTTALLNEEFTPRLLLMLAVILGTTVTYSSVIMLSLTDTSALLLMYLLWREMKAFFCLWTICYASSKSQSICQQLIFKLATTLALEPGVAKAKNLQAYSMIHRWYTVILRERPRVLSGSVITLGLDVPLKLLDISVNYVLIIVQIYVAYN